MVVPGFVPTPQGSVLEYMPTWTEGLVCIGIWAFGLLLFSWMLHLAIPIMTDRFHAKAPAGAL
jgi:molybdopterin-containing oxidoreductase family membrane subunit